MTKWKIHTILHSHQWTVQAQRLGQRFPTLGIPNTMKGCVDLYDVTEDWIPIYDRSCVGGFYMACGTSGNQFKNAPVAGKAMAALVENRDPVLVVVTGEDQRIRWSSRTRLTSLLLDFMLAQPIG